MAKRITDIEKSAKTASRIGIILGIIVTLVVSNVLFTMATGVHFRSGVNVLDQKKGSGYIKQEIIANRGYIYDGNGDIIAQDIDSYDLFAYVDESRVNAGSEPVYVVDIDLTSQQLGKVIGKTEKQKTAATKYFKETLQAAKENNKYQVSFGKYGKNLSAETKEKIEDLKLPGLDFTKSVSRVYPSGYFASQLIGYTKYDEEGNLEGVSGMENTFDNYLKGTNGLVTYQTDANNYRLPNTQKYSTMAESGSDVYLTINRDVQLTLEKALKDTMESNSANYAWGIVMEAKTGKILAQAGYPSFDLNTKEDITYHYNIPSERPFEVGSVMKAFVYAAAMNEGVYDGDATFKSGSAHVGWVGNNRVGRVFEEKGKLTTIKDALGKDYGVISFDEGLIRSTNTSIVSLLTDYLDIDKNVEYLRDKFKLFDPVDIYGMNEVSGNLNLDHELNKIMLGFGQASTVNSYALVQAATALFNDGEMVKPYIVEKIQNPNTQEILYEGKTEVVGNPITKETSKQIKGLMQKVVEEDYGTAHHYQLTDVTMLAKTGTGQLVEEGKEKEGYSTTYYTSSILAGAPADDPEIIVYYAFESSNILSYNTAYFQDIVREALSATGKYTDASNSATDAGKVDETETFKEYQMPALVNHSTEYVENKLSEYKLNKVFIGDGTSIVAQFPLENNKVISNQNVFLLTDGTNITMPNMSGWSRKDVSIFAKYSGIDITYKGSGRVKSQSIAKGKSLSKDTKLEVELE